MTNRKISIFIIIFSISTSQTLLAAPHPAKNAPVASPVVGTMALARQLYNYLFPAHLEAQPNQGRIQAIASAITTWARSCCRAEQPARRAPQVVEAPVEALVRYELPAPDQPIRTPNQINAYYGQMIPFSRGAPAGSRLVGIDLAMRGNRNLPASAHNQDRLRAAFGRLDRLRDMGPSQVVMANPNRPNQRTVILATHNFVFPASAGRLFEADADIQDLFRRVANVMDYMAEVFGLTADLFEQAVQQSNIDQSSHFVHEFRQVIVETRRNAGAVRRLHPSELQAYLLFEVLSYMFYEQQLTTLSLQQAMSLAGRFSPEYVRVFESLMAESNVMIHQLLVALHPFAAKAYKRIHKSNLSRPNDDTPLLRTRPNLRQAYELAGSLLGIAAPGDNGLPNQQAPLQNADIKPLPWPPSQQVAEQKEEKKEKEKEKEEEKSDRDGAHERVPTREEQEEAAAGPIQGAAARAAAAGRVRAPSDGALPLNNEERRVLFEAFTHQSDRAELMQLFGLAGDYDRVFKRQDIMRIAHKIADVMVERLGISREQAAAFVKEVSDRCDHLPHSAASGELFPRHYIDTTLSAMIQNGVWPLEPAWKPLRPEHFEGMAVYLKRKAKKLGMANR